MQLFPPMIDRMGAGGASILIVLFILAVSCCLMTGVTQSIATLAALNRTSTQTAHKPQLHLNKPNHWGGNWRYGWYEDTHWVPSTNPWSQATRHQRWASIDLQPRSRASAARTRPTSFFVDERMTLDMANRMANCNAFPRPTMHTHVLHVCVAPDPLINTHGAFTQL